MTAIQAREKTVDIVRLALVFLGAVAAWECARSLGWAVRTAGFLHGADFLVQLDALLFGAGTELALQERAALFLAHHAGLVVSALFLLGVAALLARMFFAGPLLDYLYVEAETRERRTMVGFLVVVLGLIVQISLLYVMVLFARPTEAREAHSATVPLLMLAYLGIGAVWMLLLRIGAAKEDSNALRGFWPALIANVLVGAGLGYALWRLNGASPEAADTVRQAVPERNVALAALAALLLCSLDSFFQGRLYGKTHGRNALRALIMSLLLVALLAFGAYMLGMLW